MFVKVWGLNRRFFFSFLDQWSLKWPHIVWTFYVTQRNKLEFPKLLSYFFFFLKNFYIETESQDITSSAFPGDYNTLWVVSSGTRRAITSSNPREFYCLNVVDSIMRRKPDMYTYWALEGEHKMLLSLHLWTSKVFRVWETPSWFMF